MISPKPFSRTATLLASVVLGTTLAHAQTAPVCYPPCAPNEVCVAGNQCAPASEPPPAPADPDAPPAAPAEAPSAAPEQPQPPPAASEQPPAEAAVPSDEAEDEADEAPRTKRAPRSGLPRRKGLLLLPFAGLHLVRGIAAEDYDVGGRFGFLLGARVHPRVSLNVETAFDILSVDTNSVFGSNSGVDVSGHDLTVAFSPLFHGGTRTIELVVGPKLGYWSDNFTTRVQRQTIRESQSGWAIGANVGGFIAVSEYASVGLLLSYQFISPVSACGHGPSNDDRDCVAVGPFPPEILGITAAALF